MKNAYDIIKELTEKLADLRAKASEKMDDMQRLLGEYPEEYAAQIEELQIKITKIEEENPFRAIYDPENEFQTATLIGIYKTEQDAKEALNEIKDHPVFVKNKMTEKVIFRLKNENTWHLDMRTVSREEFTKWLNDKRKTGVYYVAIISANGIDETEEKYTNLADARERAQDELYYIQRDKRKDRVEIRQYEADIEKDDCTNFDYNIIPINE